MFVCTERKKDARERFWPVVDERSITEKLHHQLSSLGIESFSCKQSQFGGRQTDFKVLLAAANNCLESAIEALKCFWQPRVFLG
ncbi:hypothetical protein PoB_006963000 [Plakobranchus ocellatus]|uniref:Uncharacterized protein n=1 Tax=Plakobranchus ocellatus TaxID=259542 RepID=A0AAV4DGF9_9GAST|nr:hypothetical protein PoB_006963000 [Plakobranchus ocellatus]